MAVFQEDKDKLSAEIRAEMQKLREENATLKKEVDTLLGVCQHAASKSSLDNYKLKEEFQKIMLKYYNELYIDSFIGDSSSHHIMMWAFGEP